MNSPYYRYLLLTILAATLTPQTSLAQGQQTYMRMAKISVDSAQLDDYLIALKTQIQSALIIEEGVLAYSAVQNKNTPTEITILETYASVEAYQSHIQTSHFKKYKDAVAGMVTRLELTDITPITLQSKQR